jgi:hypothetical protein
MGDARYLDLPDSAFPRFYLVYDISSSLVDARKGTDVKLGNVLLFVGGEKGNKCERED